MRFSCVICFTALFVGVVATEVKMDVQVITPYEAYSKQETPTFFKNIFQYTPDGLLKTDISSAIWLYELLKDKNVPLSMTFETTCPDPVVLKMTFVGANGLIDQTVSFHCGGVTNSFKNNDKVSYDLIKNNGSSCIINYRMGNQMVEVWSGRNKPGKVEAKVYYKFQSPDFELPRVSPKGGVEADLFSMNIFVQADPQQNCERTMTFGPEHFVLLYKATKANKEGGTTTTQVGGVTEPHTDTATTEMATTEESKEEMLDFKSAGTILWVMLYTLCGLTSLSVGSVCMFFALHCLAKRQKKKAQAENEDVHTGVDRDSAILPVIAPPYAPPPEKNPSASGKNGPSASGKNGPSASGKNNASASRQTQTSLTTTGP